LNSQRRDFSSQAVHSDVPFYFFEWFSDVETDAWSQTCTATIPTTTLSTDHFTKYSTARYNISDSKCVSVISLSWLKISRTLSISCWHCYNYDCKYPLTFIWSANFFTVTVCYIRSSTEGNF